MQCFTVIVLSREHRRLLCTVRRFLLQLSLLQKLAVELPAARCQQHVSTEVQVLLAPFLILLNLHIMSNNYHRRDRSFMLVCHKHCWLVI